MCRFSLLKLSIVIIIASLSLAYPAHAQSRLKKANRAFESLEYAKAIPLYEKALKKGHRDTMHLSRLAQAYHLTDNYLKEELIFLELIRLPGIPNEYYFRYGEALKNNNKYAEAKGQFEKYHKLVPSDENALRMIDACEKIIAGVDSLISVAVINFTQVNTKFSEFSPYPYRKGMILTSDRKKNFIDVDKYEWTARPFLSMYYYPSATMEDSLLAKPKALNNSVNDDFHNGPGYFYNDTTLYFTRVSKVKQKQRQTEIVHRAKIFHVFFNPDEKKKWWEKNKIAIYPFQYNSDDYSVGHPSFTPDGNYLFFSSDMPGGYGGKDIYVSVRNDSGWAKPQNLGSEVNTSGDELFPFAKNEKTVYFSSNGHPGHGGMDIFSASRLNENWWTLVQNLKAPINSPTDDFGIFFTGKNAGYFSSNRKGGIGFDDIYFFDIIRRNISGRIFNPVDSSPLTNRLIFLKDGSGRQVDSTFTNDKGFFAFKNLKSDESYSTMMAENDLGMAGYIDNTFNQEPRGIRVYITDKQRKILDSLQLESMEYFTYWRLKAMSYEAAVAGLIDIGMKSQNFIDFEGFVGIEGRNDTLPLAGVSMLLNSESGDVQKVGITDKDGKFRFDSIPNNQFYLLSMAEKDVPANTENHYVVTGKIFQSGTMDKPISNARFYFAGQNNRKLRAVFTDKGGYFHFDFMPKDYYGMKAMFPDATDPMFIPIEESEDSFIVSVKKTAAIDSAFIDITGNIYYSGDSLQPAASLDVVLKGETGNMIKKSTTDTLGAFKFMAVPNNQNYSVSLDEENPKFNPNLTYLILGNIDYHGQEVPVGNFKLFLGGKFNEKLFEMVTDKSGRFKLNYLPADHYPVAELKEEDIKIFDGKKESRIVTSYVLLFDYAKSDVLEEYRAGLNGLIAMMQSDSSLKMEITAHTDSKGNDSYNMQLSKRRAGITRQYFISNHISGRRIIMKALGESQPVAANNNPDGSDNAEGRKQNRRAEIKIFSGELKSISGK